MKMLIIGFIIGDLVGTFVTLVVVSCIIVGTRGETDEID